MGKYDAIIAQRSLSVSNALETRSAADAKRQELLINAGTLARHAYESVEAYQKRIKEHREELAKKTEAENTQIVERRLKNITLFNTNMTDPTKLKGTLNELQYILSFAHNNKISASIDGGIYLAKQQEAITENQLAKLQQGIKPQDNSSNPLRYYDFEFQDAGSRDMLA